MASPRQRSSPLPVFFAAMPWASIVLAEASRLPVFSWMRDTADVLIMVFLLPPMLLWDALGVVHWNVLGGTPRLLGSERLADALYALTSSVGLFLLGALLQRPWRGK